MGFFLTLFWYAFFFVLSELLRPKPKLENAKPAGLGDFQFPTATEGRVVPLVWGTVQIKGPNVVWYGDLRQIAIQEKVKTGLFSSENVIVGFKYRVGVQYALCRGPGAVLKKVWVGDTRVFTGTVVHDDTFEIDRPFLFGGDTLGNGGVQGDFRWFGGEPDQDVSSYLANFQVVGPNNRTPAYRDICYLAPDTEPTYLGNSPSIKPWKFEVQRIPNGLSLSGGGIVNGADANPMNVIYEILTNTSWGLGFDPSEVNTSMFVTAANVLTSEGNGFSHLQDTPIEGVELLKLLEEQIDGVLYLNSGVWEVKLARDDYDISLVPEVNSSNLVEMTSFSRGSWEDTTNIITVNFIDRDDEWKQTFALAQDMANQRLQNGVNVSATKNFPGCKNATLANSLAWRTLKTVTYPLAKASFVVDRTFYDVKPGDVIAFTDSDLGFDRLAMRVTRVDLGDMQDNRIKLDVVQDIWSFQLGVFGDPTTTNWTPPTDVLQPFPAGQQMAIEAPRAFIIRDPLYNGIADKIWCGARQFGPEVSYEIHERHAAGTPTGAYALAGENFAFLYIGELNGSLSVGSAFPLTSLLVTPTPDSQSAIEAAFNDAVTLSDLGVDLQNLILVGSEFMLVTSAQISGGNVQLNNVWRGALDSVQTAHSSGTGVWLVFVGGGLTDTSFTPGHNVDIKLLPKSLSDTVDISAATAISVALANRVRKPYPPSSLRLNGTLWNASASLEGTGANPENYALGLEIRRRDYRTTDELQALDTDAADIFSDFPTANSTDHQIQVRVDPAGTNTLLFTETISGKTHSITRIRILQATDGVLPTTMRLVTTARHTDAAVLYSSVQSLLWDFSVTSGLSGQFNFGALDTNDVSNLYTATTNGTYNFTLSSAFTAGDVEYRLNGGAWTSLITAGNTNGSIVGVVATDTIEVRHTSSDVGALKQLDMNAAGAGQDGYAIFFV